MGIIVFFLIGLAGASLKKRADLPESRSQQEMPAEPAVPPVTKAPPIQNWGNGMPDSQRNIVEVIEKFVKIYQNSTNEMRKATLSEERRGEVRAAVNGSLQLKDWIGRVKSIEWSFAQKGILILEIPAPSIQIHIGTWNNFLSDSGDNTLIDKDSSVGSILKSVEVGDWIQFSGTAISDRSEFLRIVQPNTNPHIIIRFSSIRTLK